MCQAIPRKVLQVADGRAEVLSGGRRVWVAIHGLPDLRAGEYVVVYAGHAIERMPVDDAEAVLRFYEEVERMVEEAVG